MIFGYQRGLQYLNGIKNPTWQIEILREYIKEIMGQPNHLKDIVQQAAEKKEAFFEFVEGIFGGNPWASFNPIMWLLHWTRSKEFDYTTVKDDPFRSLYLRAQSAPVIPEPESATFVDFSEQPC